MNPYSLEKLLSVEIRLTVLQTDTGGLVEYTEAIERFQAKELCKILP